jgi:outer membrane receptor protein involved in Fe transport
VYNLLLSYTLPTPTLPAKNVRFDLNVQNLFNERYWQYYYSQIPPVNGLYLGNAYEDGLPGEPFSVTFTVTARF